MITTETTWVFTCDSPECRHYYRTLSGGKEEAIDEAGKRGWRRFYSPIRWLCPPCAKEHVARLV